MSEIVINIWNVLKEGFSFLIEYAFYPKDGETFSLMRIASLFIAFSISGAIGLFLSQSAVIRHLGPTAKKWRAYLVASVSGTVLAVCSCSVLPMFASIRKKGAGLGPAVAFLFSGPAINVLAITLTFSDLGIGIGTIRVIGAVILALVIGTIMAFIYRRSEVQDTNAAMFKGDDGDSTFKPWQKLVFFLTLLAMLIFSVYQPLPTLIFIAILSVAIIAWLDMDDLREWGGETWSLAKKILPLFVVGIFFAGILQAVLSEDFLASTVGGNTLFSNGIASVAGALMYFATLTEIPIIVSLLETGMHRGPAVALLLAGPTLSLPNMIVIGKVLGVKKTLTYVGMVALFATIIGYLSGLWFF
ncbi:MAG: permease [Candidatus Izemoplasmataceae bacterium]